MTQIQAAIEEARTQLLYVQPFYALMLQKCRINLTEQVKTAGVRVLPTGQIELAICPSFFMSLESHARIGLLMHEMLHLFMNHINRGKAHSDKLTANVAMDIAINQFIDQKYLPPEALLPEKYQLPRDREFEFYYGELTKQKQEQPKQPKQPGQSGQSGQPQDSGDSNQSDQSQESQKESEEDQGSQGASQPSDQPQGQQAGNGEQTIDNHDWSEGSSGEVQDLVVEQMMKECSEEMERRFAGKTPVHIEKLLGEINKPKKVNWKAELKKYMGRHVSQERESTRTRPNRRMGFAAQGHKRDYQPKITIAFDQSASMGGPEVAAAFGEIKHLLKNQEESTEIVYFDTEIGHTETIRRPGQLQAKRHRDGGTDFDCVVDYLPKAKSDLCIIMTDGEASQPKKSKTPILWVIVGQKRNRDIKLDGPKIFIDLE